MTYITTKNKMLIFLLVIILLLFGIYFFTKKDVSNETSFMEEETIVYLGDTTSENEVLFIFDYSCSWCHRWIDDIFPDVSELIEENELKFRTQSLALLDHASLELTKLDQLLKVHYPEQYFDIFWQMIADGKDTSYSDLLEDDYMNQLITTHQLDKDLLLAEPALNVVELTDLYKDKLMLKSVPTLVVNGEMVEDPFNFNEIKDLLK